MLKTAILRQTLGTLLVLGSVAGFLQADSDEALRIFDQRIRPILKSPQPSSCIQCHLSSVDLKQYILPSGEATFASLRDQGLVNLDQPRQSKILELIRMGEKDADEAARLIHAKTRVAELEAFAAWIEACCADERYRKLPGAAQMASPSVPDEVIRHARKSRVVDSFVRNVWSQRMRCFPCHTPHEIDSENPRHQAALKKRKEFEEQYGPEMLARLEIFKETPEATLNYLVQSSDAADERPPLINLAEPVASLIVQKPMSKLPPKLADGSFAPPSFEPPYSHMGGIKLHRNDQGYKSIVSWIEDYADVVNGRYRKVEELPADNWHPTQHVVRVTQAPDDWQPLQSVQLFVHAWNEKEARFGETPVAFTQGVVTPRRIVNGALFLLGAPNASTESPHPLTRGRYLIKAYLDRTDRLATEPTAILNQQDFAGQVEIPKARWREGFRNAEVVQGTKLQRKPAHPTLAAVEADPHEFMEYAFEPFFHALKASLAEEPQSGKAWKPVKANALILAENGNLLTFRGPKGDDATEWIALATELREQGRRVYQAAKKRNYPQARAAMKSFTESCNACHHRFADGEHLQSP